MCKCFNGNKNNFIVIVIVNGPLPIGKAPRHQKGMYPSLDALTYRTHILLHLQYIVTAESIVVSEV